MIELIEVLKAVLFGIVEGVTEWLPISSTGHLILLNEVVKLKVSDEFYSMFEVVIQLGAILAVVVLFWSQIWPFGRKNNVAPLTKRGPGAWIKTDIFKLWFHILVSTIPAAVIGVLADDWVEEHFYNYQMVSVMLILFGIAFILIENSHKGKNSRINSLADIGYDTALFIGLFQLIAAIFPGTSRSGATIVGALLIGVSRTVAAEYTFFLAIPVMFGASILKIAKFGLDFSTSEVVILFVGCVIAFAVSLIVIRFLMGYIKRHDFKAFGWYRIVLGLLVLGGVSLWKADLFARFAQAVPEGVPVLVCCAVCAVSAANFLTTPSVSLEGRTVWLLQSLPIPSWQALCAKLELHLLLTGVPAALCLVCIQAAVQMPPVYFCLTLLEAELFVLLSAEMGLALGLVLPNLHWTSEAAVIKMSGCTLLSMAANLVAVLVLTLAQTNLLKILPLPAVMAAALVLLAGADGLLGHWLKTRGARRLAELS